MLYVTENDIYMVEYTTGNICLSIHRVGTVTLECGSYLHAQLFVLHLPLSGGLAGRRRLRRLRSRLELADLVLVFLPRLAGTRLLQRPRHRRRVQAFDVCQNLELPLRED